jgi:hypothetical protein
LPKTRLISPGSIPNHKLLKNLQLQDNYLSNDGGDEGIRITDAGLVGVNSTVIAPTTTLEVFNPNVQYSTGTAYQYGNGIVGSGTTFTTAMVGGRFVFDDGTDAGIITGFAVSNVLQVSISQTVGADGDWRSYKIYYSGVHIDVGATSTDLRVGGMLISKDEIDLSTIGDFTVDARGDIVLSADGGNVTMNDGTVEVFDFDVDTPSLTIYDDADTDGDRDYFKIAVGGNGATALSTNDDDGADADFTLTVDGGIKLTTSTFNIDNFILLQGAYTAIIPQQKTSSTINDYTLLGQEVLDLGSGAGGSDAHYGIKYNQIQTDLTGWDSVYLMYITGGDAARTFAIQADGKVGIGVTDPASPLEIFNTASQLKISYDASNYADISVADDGHLELATTGGVNSEITLDAAGQINIEPSRYIYLRKSDATDGLIEIDLNSDPLITIKSDADAGDTFSLQVNDAGATTIATNDDDGATAHLTLDADGDINLNARADVNIPADIGLTFGDAGEKIEGNGTDLYIESSRHIGMAAGGSFYLDATNGTYFFRDNADATDHFKLTTVSGTGATTLETVSAAADGHLSIVADGHVEFDGCAVGFDKETTTFAASDVLGEGDDSTDIDFRLGNKHELGLTDNIGGSGENINMIFPATSGNFLLVLTQDASGSRTVAADGWIAYQSDGATKCTNNLSANLTDGDVRWAGGEAPTLSTGARAVDVISIYWDADNQTALAVASLAFATP